MRGGRAHCVTSIAPREPTPEASTAAEIGFAAMPENLGPRLVAQPDRRFEAASGGCERRPQMHVDTAPAWKPLIGAQDRAGPTDRDRQDRQPDLGSDREGAHAEGAQPRLPREGSFGKENELPVGPGRGNGSSSVLDRDFRGEAIDEDGTERPEKRPRDELLRQLAFSHENGLSRQHG